LAAGLTGLGRPDSAVFAVPAVGLGVVAWLAGHYACGNHRLHDTENRQLWFAAQRASPMKRERPA
jgi:hypothetical protein